jgi:hypothetical protein
MASCSFRPKGISFSISTQSALACPIGPILLVLQLTCIFELMSSMISKAYMLSFSSGPNHATNSLCQSIYISHPFNLMTPFYWILLINADSINPENSRLVLVPKVRQCNEEILRNSDGIISELSDRDIDWIFRTSPSVRQSLTGGLSAVNVVVSMRMRISGEEFSLSNVKSLISLASSLSGAYWYRATGTLFVNFDRDQKENEAW